MALYFSFWAYSSSEDRQEKQESEGWEAAMDRNQMKKEKDKKLMED